MTLLPLNFNSEAPLPGDGEGLLRELFAWRRYCTGSDFGGHIVSETIIGKILGELLDHCSIKSYQERECKYWMLMAHVNTDNPKGVRKHLNYWWGSQYKEQKKFANVSRFIPGQHYHCLDEKFDTLEEAKSHIVEKGFVFGELVKKYVYVREGD